MPYYIFAWLACFTSACTVIITKLTSKHSIANPWLFNFLWSSVILLLTLPVALISGAGMPKDLPPIILGGIFAALWNIFYIQSMYKIDVTTLSPLFNFRLIFALLLGSIFFQEQLTTSQFQLFGLILLGGIFASSDEKLKLSGFFKPNIGIGLLAMLFLAVNNAFIKLALVNNDLWTANLWMAVVTLVTLIPTINFFKKDASKITKKQLFPVFLMGLLQLVTNAAANFAYSKNLTINSLIMAVPLSMVIAFLFSIFAPKLLEKHTLKIYLIRFSSAIIMIWAALQLSH
jgi:drug/metabolite transporter (DMT)-like permease